MYGLEFLGLEFEALKYVLPGTTQDLFFLMQGLSLSTRFLVGNLA